MLRIDKLLSVAFVAGPLVALLAAVPFVLPDTDDLNRTPVAFPELSPGSLVSTDTYSDIGLWLRDRVPLRAKLRRLDARVNRGLFRDVDATAIVDGRDGWLFYDQSLANALKPGFDPGRIRTGIARLEQIVTGSGKTFRFAIAPHKPTIYPQFLRDRDRERQNHARERLEQFREAMRADPVPGFLDVWDEMEAAAAASRSPIYLPRDTHWAPQGAAVMAEAVVNSISPHIFETAVLSERGSRSYTPDLVKISGLNEKEAWPRFSLKRPGARSTLVERSDASRMWTAGWATKTGKSVELLPRIAVIHDSYGFALRPLLAPFFSRASFIHVNATDTEFAHRAIADADIVLFLVIERFFYDISQATPFGPYSIGTLEVLESSLARGS